MFQARLIAPPRMLHQPLRLAATSRVHRVVRPSSARVKQIAGAVGQKFVRYPFRMGDSRIRSTMGIQSKGARARFTCETCGHSVVVSGAIASTMFPGPTLLEDIITRLRCSNCGAKKARIEVLRRPSRD